MDEQLVIALITGTVAIGGAWIAARSQFKISQTEAEKAQQALSDALWKRSQAEFERLNKCIDTLEAENKLQREELEREREARRALVFELREMKAERDALTHENDDLRKRLERLEKRMNHADDQLGNTQD